MIYNCNEKSLMKLIMDFNIKFPIRNNNTMDVLRY